MLKVFFAFLFAVYSGVITASWSSVETKDEFTDELRSYAVYSDDEHRLQLSHEGSAVWMFITRKKIGTIEPDGLIEIRVDDNKTLTIDPIKQKQLSKMLGNPAFKWEPSTVGFLLWHGKEDESCGFIGQMLDGKRLKVRYQTNSLTRDSFAVDLIGAKSNIINGLSLKICGN